jgi:cytochrome d ubiquinol oxidase subunit II
VTLLLGVRALPQAAGSYPAWFLMLLTAGLLALTAVFSARDRHGRAFVASALGMVTLWLTAAIVQYPLLLRAADGQGHLTIRNASSSPLTLKVMLIIALIGMPFVLAYTIYVYRIFTRKPKQEGA